MLDNDFFSSYNGQMTSKTKSIPGITMNRPLTGNTLQGSIGLELEIEALTPSPNEGHLDAIRGAQTGAKWAAIRDGSLRGDYSREYVLTTPCTTEELEPLLTGLFKTFDKMKTVIQNTNRCSTHVHLNMRGKKVNQITAIICLWTVFEDFLIAIQGEERVNNHFTLSNKVSNSTINAWFDFLKYGNNHFENNLKYQALNVLPLFERGSLENRCGQAANDAQTPLLWALFLDALANYASQNYNLLPRLGQDISERGGHTIFFDLCNQNPKFDVIYNKVMTLMGSKESVDRACLEGFRNCQQLVYGLPWYDWQPLINKEYVPNPFDYPKKEVKLRPPRFPVLRTAEDLLPRTAAVIRDEQVEEVEEVELFVPEPRPIVFDVGDRVRLADARRFIGTIVDIQNNVAGREQYIVHWDTLRRPSELFAENLVRA